MIRLHKITVYLGVVLALAGIGGWFAQTISRQLPHGSGDPLVLGVLLEESEPVSSLSLGVWHGVEMAVGEINSQGGVAGHPLEVVRGKAEDGQAVWRDKRVIAVLGGLTQGGADGLVQESKRYDKVLLVLNSSPHLVDGDGKAFQIGYDDQHQGVMAARFAARHWQGKRVVVATESGSAYSRTLARAFAEEYLRLGGQVAEVLTVDGGSGGAAEAAKKIQLMKPDLVYAPLYGRSGAALVTQTYKRGIQTSFLGGDAWEGDSFMAGLDKGVKNPIFHTTANLLPLSEAQGFREMYEDRYGTEPSPQALWAYEGIRMLARGLQSGGPEGLVSALDSGQAITVIGGEFGFGSRHQALRPLAVVEIVGNKRRIKEVMAPEG